MNHNQSFLKNLLVVLGAISASSNLVGSLTAANYDTDAGDVTITAVAEGDMITGSGTLYYSANSATTFDVRGVNLDASTFSGTGYLTNVKLNVGEQANIGSTENLATYYVNEGSQFWIHAAAISANLVIAGHGTGSGYNDNGALRFEGGSSLKGSLTLAADSSISTFYSNQTGSAKNLAASVDLGSYSLYLGASPNADPDAWEWKDASYWYTDLTVSGKVSGEGNLIIRNNKKIYLTNSANDFTGGIEIQKGTLSVSNAAVLGGNNTNVVQIDKDGILESSTTLSNTKVTGNGELAYLRSSLGDIAASVDASEFTGTVSLTNVRLQTTSQSNIGAAPSEDGTPNVTVNVNDGSQLWLYKNGTNTPITATFNIAGMGYANTNDGQGAIRFEEDSSIDGVVNLTADAAISTFYNLQSASQKKLMADVNLGEHTLWIGAGKNFDMKNWVETKTNAYLFTGLTVSGKISGTGSIVVYAEKNIILSNVENDYSGGSIVKFGTLEITDSRALGTGPVVVMENGVLTLNNPSENGGTNALNITLEKGGNLTRNSGSFTNMTLNLAEGAEYSMTFGSSLVTPTFNIAKDAVLTSKSSGLTSPTINVSEGGTFVYVGGGLSKPVVTGNGTFQYSTDAASDYSVATADFSNFHGVIELDSIQRLRVEGQKGLGASDVTVNVTDGSQLWFISAGSVTGTFNIAGMGYGASENGQGAIRLESANVLGGQINLMDNAAISTFYHSESGTSKTISANINLDEHTLWLGASGDYAMENYSRTDYFFTDATVSGKISGAGNIGVNNSKTIYLTNQNDFTGSTEVKYGTLALNAENAIADSSNVKNNGKITFNENQTLHNLSGTNEDASLVGSTGKTLTLVNSQDSEYVGLLNVSSLVFGNGAEDSSIGSLTLSGTVNSLTSLALNVGVSDDEADRLILDSFDPHATELSIAVGVITDSLSGDSEYEILRVENGTLSTDVDWSSFLNEGSADLWSVYLNSSANALLLGVDGNKIPEPSAFLLLLSAVGSLFLLKRKK